MNNEEIRSIFKNILMTNDKEDVKNSLLDWKESCSEKLFYSTKTGMESVAIPQGIGLYRTLVRNARTRKLEISNKRYQSVQLLRRHNAMVPGGITVRELQNSDLSWCMQFMEELDD